MKAEFFILGVLHRGDFHPYEIKRRLNNALVECYTDVDVGTLYLCRAATGQIGGYRAKSEAEGYARRRTHDLPNYISGPKAISAAFARAISRKRNSGPDHYPVLLLLDLANLPAPS